MGPYNYLSVYNEVLNCIITINDTIFNNKISYRIKQYKNVSFWIVSYDFIELEDKKYHVRKKAPSNYIDLIFNLFEWKIVIKYIIL